MGIQKFKRGIVAPSFTGAGTVGTSTKLKKANMALFTANAQTGTGALQVIPHGLGVVPAFVTISFTGSTPAQTVTYGTHTFTNIVVTVTSGATFDVIALA